MCLWCRRRRLSSSQNPRRRLQPSRPSRLPRSPLWVPDEENSPQTPSARLCAIDAIPTDRRRPAETKKTRRWTKHRSCPHASDGLLRTLNPKWCRQSRILRLLPRVTRARFCCGDRDGFDNARASANSFCFRSSLFRRWRHTYGIASKQDTPQVQ